MPGPIPPTSAQPSPPNEIRGVPAVAMAPSTADRFEEGAQWNRNAPGFVHRPLVELRLGKREDLKRLWVSGDILTHASRMCAAMFASGMRESESNRVALDLDVPSQAWWLIMADLHDEGRCKPSSDDAVALHSAVDFLDPTAARGGRILQRIAGDCLEVAQKVPAEAAIKMYEEALTRDNDTMQLAAAGRLLATADDCALLELTSSTLVALVTSKPWIDAPVAGLGLVTQWIIKRAPGRMDRPGVIEAEGLRDLFDWSRWSPYHIQTLGVEAGYFSKKQARAIRARRRDVAHGGAAFLRQPLCEKISFGSASDGLRDISVSGDLVVASRCLGEISLWNKVTGQWVRRLQSSRTYWHRMLPVAINDEIIVGGGFGAASVWDRRTYKRLATLNGVADALFVADDIIVTGGEYERHVNIWFRDGFKHRQAVPVPNGTTFALCVHGDVIVGGSRNAIHLWDRDTGEYLRAMKGHTDRVNSVCVTDHHVFSGSEDETVRIWNLKTGDLQATLQAQGPVTSLAITPDTIVSGCHSGIEVWDRKSGVWLQMTETYDVRAMCVTNECLVTGNQWISDGSVSVFEAAPPQRKRRIFSQR